MAVALDTSIKRTVSAAGFTQSFTCSGSDRFLRVSVGVWSPSTAAISGITYNGVALTRIGTLERSDNTHVDVWGLVAPATGANNLVVSMSGSGDFNGGCVIECWTGVDQTTPYDGVTTAQGSNSTPAINVSSASGKTVADSVASWDIGAASTTQSGQTLIQSETGNSDAQCSTSYRAGQTTTAMGWSITGASTWAMLGMSINAAAGGGGASVVPVVMNHFRQRRA